MSKQFHCEHVIEDNCSEGLLTIWVDGVESAHICEYHYLTYRV